MSDIKLTYFDFPGGRGEDCRLALHIAGVDFEDDRVKGSTWSDRKASTPYGSLPVLSVRGQDLGQSNAILRFIGSHHDLLPEDAWEAAQHDAVMSSVEEMRAKFSSARMKDADAKKAAREELAAGAIPAWGAAIEAQICEGPFLAGDRLSVADLKLFVFMRQIVSGGLDHVSPEIFAVYPKLTALYQAVESVDGVKSWYAR